MIAEKQPDTILHLGAGRCSEFPEWDASGARRIILVEADPEKARYLRTTYGQDERVEVVERAVSGTGGAGRLRILNVRQFASFREPTGLRELYPGLRIVDEVTVDAISADDFCTDFEISESVANWLVVDVPGEEGAVLAVLQSSGWLKSFERIILSASHTISYEGASSAEQILGDLVDNGYEVVSQSGSEQSHPRWVMVRDSDKLLISELEQRLTELETDLERSSELLTRESARANDAAQSVSSLTEQLQAARAETADSKAELLQIASELERAKTERDDLVARVASLQKELEIVKGQQEDFTTCRSELATERSRNSLLKREIDRAEAQLGLLKEFALPSADS